MLDVEALVGSFGRAAGLPRAANDIEGLSWGLLKAGLTGGER